MPFLILYMFSSHQPWSQSTAACQHSMEATVWGSATVETGTMGILEKESPPLRFILIYFQYVQPRFHQMQWRYQMQRRALAGPVLSRQLHWAVLTTSATAVLLQSSMFYVILKISIESVNSRGKAYTAIASPRPPPLFFLNFSEQFCNSQVFQEMQVCDLLVVRDTQLCFCMGQGTTFVTPVLFYTKARLQ